MRCYYQDTLLCRLKMFKLRYKIHALAKHLSVPLSLRFALAFLVALLPGALCFALKFLVALLPWALCFALEFLVALLHRALRLHLARFVCAHFGLDSSINVQHNTLPRSMILLIVIMLYRA